MAIVSYRIYCNECNNETVIREKSMDTSNWKISSKTDHTGVCPLCNDLVDVDESNEQSDNSSDQSFRKEINFEELSGIGATGAENLREAGYVTRSDITDASDGDLLSISAIGQGAVDTIRTNIK